VIDIRHYAGDLVRTDSGMWRSAGSEAVSYPESGHMTCLQVEDRSFWFRHRNACILAAVARHRPQGPLFDIGGGNGFVAHALIAAGLPTVLVEPGQQGAANALRRGVEHVVCATLGSAGFRAGSLPAVGAFDVIEHTQDDAGFVGELVRLLKPGGWLFATVPAHGWLWSDADRAAGHWRRYARHSFAGRLRQAGLDLVYSTMFFRWLPLPILLGRVLPFRLGLRRSEAESATAARQHGVNGGLRVRLASRLLAAEVAAIEEGRSMPVGASILAVARKPGP
jgi:SAM-dependent methyltransferase